MQHFNQDKFSNDILPLDPQITNGAGTKPRDASLPEGTATQWNYPVGAVIFQTDDHVGAVIFQTDDIS